MSYCRFAWDGSDVYVYRGDEGLVCCGCFLKKHFSCETEEEMILHLGDHRRKENFVPEYAITSLWHEIPGQTRPKKHEPKSLTKATLSLDISRLEIERDRLLKSNKVE